MESTSMKCVLVSCVALATHPPLRSSPSPMWLSTKPTKEEVCATISLCFACWIRCSSIDGWNLFAYPTREELQ